VVRALTAAGVAWREVRYAAVDTAPPVVLFRVRLTNGLRLWDEPDGDYGETVYPIGTEYDVLEIRPGWFRVPGGWIPDGAWLTRI
jgi:hypothetical protein